MKYTVKDAIIRTQVGEPVEITVTAAGASGYLWRVRTDDAKVRVRDHRVFPTTESFGGVGEEAFVLEPLQAGDTAITFTLERPWNGQPAEEHIIHLSSE